MSASSDVLGSLVAAGLPGVPRDRGLPAGPEWNQLMAAAHDERAVAILASGVVGGFIAADPEQARELQAAHLDLMSACLRLERATLEVATSFDERGIEYRLLKGPAVAHLDYPDPSWRAFGDVDVLVRARDYDAAVAALEDAGARRRSAEIRPGFDRRFAKGVCLILPSGVQVDLHRTLAPGPFGLTFDPEVLFAEHATVTFGGRELPVLTPEHRLVHACLHAALGDATPRVVALRDIAQMLITTDVDVVRARAIARAWRAEAVVAVAVTEAWVRLGLPPHPAAEWAAGFTPSKFERRALAAYRGPGRSHARLMVAGVPAIRGFGSKVAYVRSLLVVDREYARAHDGGYGRRLRRAWRAMIGDRA